MLAFMIQLYLSTRYLSINVD